MKRRSFLAVLGSLVSLVPFIPRPASAVNSERNRGIPESEPESRPPALLSCRSYVVVSKSGVYPYLEDMGRISSVQLERDGKVKLNTATYVPKAPCYFHGVIVVDSNNLVLATRMMKPFFTTPREHFNTRVVIDGMKNDVNQPLLAHAAENGIGSPHDMRS